MATVADYLVQIQKLTQKNLDILKTINDSFYTKQSRLSVQIGDTAYAIPSFVSLENKINYLQEAFNNLVNAPSTGEAFFNYDGSSRSIEVRGYSTTPNRIILSPINASKNETGENTLSFGVNRNNIFKDFLTPVPYIKFDLSTLPNDITSVNVKKIIPKSEDFKKLMGHALKRFDEATGGELNPNTYVEYKWSTLYKVLQRLKEGVDYIEYDTIKKLPIRKNIGQSLYVIKDIISDITDSEFDEYITFTLRTDLTSSGVNCRPTFHLFDETIEKHLAVGDQLVTYNDNAKLEITEINDTTITVKVLNGEYLNLVGSGNEMYENVNDLSKLKFFSTINFNKDKYIDVPLEEDRFVFIAIAPLNDRMNVQAPWGTGLIVDSYALTMPVNEESSIDFSTYYKENVKNIGDILYELTSLSNSTINNLSNDELNKLLNEIKPVINQDHLKVVRINDHLNESTTVKNIRSLYKQKEDLNKKLTEVNETIAELDDRINQAKYDKNYSGPRVTQKRYDSCIQERNELSTALSKIVNDIAIAANNSEIPLENAKYRIRGFFDFHNFSQVNNISEKHIKGIQVQYRYKNPENTVANVKSISDNFTFSEWNVMNGYDRPKNAVYDVETNNLIYNLEDTGDINEPSFNQVDIPISQAESVVVRIKVIYDYGYPFIETASQWSETVTIDFPKEFVADVQILDIIDENNRDIETNRFKNILDEHGVLDHINSKVNDNDIVYYHTPEHIASGFYTTERSIIPLKDKLDEMNALLLHLQDEVFGTTSDVLNVSLTNGERNTTLYSDRSNNIILESYSDVLRNTNMEGETSIGSYEYESHKDSTGEENGVVTTVLNLVISNKSDHIVKLYSMFPGSRDTYLNDLKNYMYNVSNYCRTDSTELPGGVTLNYYGENNGVMTEMYKLQTANQFITFRINDLYTGKQYYAYPNEMIKVSSSLNVSTGSSNVSQNSTQEQSATMMRATARLSTDATGGDATGGGLGGNVTGGTENTTNKDHQSLYTGLNMYTTDGTTNTVVVVNPGGYTPPIIIDGGGSGGTCLNPIFKNVYKLTVTPNSVTEINSEKSFDYGIDHAVLRFDKEIKYINDVDGFEFRKLSKNTNGNSISNYMLVLFKNNEGEYIKYGNGATLTLPANTVCFNDGSFSNEIELEITKTEVVKGELSYDADIELSFAITSDKGKLVNITVPVGEGINKKGKYEFNKNHIVSIIDSDGNSSACNTEFNESSRNLTITPLGTVNAGNYTLVITPGVIENKTDSLDCDGYFGSLNKLYLFPFTIEKYTENSVPTINNGSIQVDANFNINNFVPLISPSVSDSYKDYGLDKNNILPLVSIAYNDPFNFNGSEYGNYGAIMYPKIKDEFALCLNNNDIRSYITLKPNEEIVVPVIVKYRLHERKLKQISKTMSFDIRTSLYKEPANYTFTVTTKYINTTLDKLSQANEKLILDKTKYTKFATSYIK